jgi:murein hydrolase activator
MTLIMPKVASTNRKKSPLTLLITLCGLLFFVPLCHAETQQELKGVKSEISRQQQTISGRNKQLNDLQSSLKKQELEISSIEKEISKTREKLSASENNIAQLKDEAITLKNKKKAQSDRLEMLIEGFYVTQQAKSPTKLFKDNSEEDRISQYYQHLAKARAEVITQLEQTQIELAQNQQQLEQEHDQIALLLTQQTDTSFQLKSAQQERKKTLEKIRSGISTDKVYLAELQRNESRLKAEIAKAAKRNAVLMNGFSSQRGKLPWPLTGQVVHTFGSIQTGQISWKGMVIAANYGQSVKAVYPGTVVFSEYLRGYGLVILLDHGKGDMTLYGFNQTLLKKEGDKVTTGEVIALAGDTGGQSSPSLYFEVRRNSRPENPATWLTH